MATELSQTPLVLVNSSVFEQGVHDGASWYFHGDTPCRHVTEEDVVELVQEGLLDADRLRSIAGFLIGWIAAQTLPPSVRPERTAF